MKGTPGAEQRSLILPVGSEKLNASCAGRRKRRKDAMDSENDITRRGVNYKVLDLGWSTLTLALTPCFDNEKRTEKVHVTCSSLYCP